MGMGVLFTIVVFLGSVSSASPGEDFHHQATPTLSNHVYLPQVFKSYAVPPTPNYRFGFGMSTYTIETYDPAQVGRLRAGTYAGWRIQANPAQPNNMEYIQIVRLHQAKIGTEYDAPYVVPYTYTLTVGTSWTTISSTAAANPGAIWLIGNEIERIDWPGGKQDEMLPELYAQAYHEIYTFIKQRDPTALVGIGGVIQPTPLRLKYLDRVWEEYKRRYGQTMPVDIWNIHGFMLREKHYYPGCPDCWGADIPAGLTETTGILYGLRDTDKLDTFKQQIITFRRWMYDKGEGDKRLIISEYGPLIPYGYIDEEGKEFTRERYREFLYGGFDWMQSATDAALGCPADENRLVQQWIWFSLDCRPTIFGGNLFDPDTKQITELGQDWEAYVNDPARMPEPHANLFPLRLSTEPDVPISSQPVTLTLRAEIANSGSLPVTEAFTVRFVDAYGTLIGDAVVSKVRCCGGTAFAQVVWPNLLPGTYQVQVWVDPGGQIAESEESDNRVTWTILVPEYGIYLPLVARI